jgi:cytochrome P450
MTLLLAGHETTANALTWTFYLLSQHPDAATKLHEEIDAVLGKRPFTLDDLPHLTYTKMVIEEAMRLYPPAYSIGRVADGEDAIMGYRVPAGTPVFMSSYVTHRRPDFWQEPERFDPERFTPERSEGRHRFAYFPFGGGPRLCIGENFALMEAQILLATIAQRYTLHHVPSHPVAMQPLITLRPRYGMEMTLQRREE